MAKEQRLGFADKYKLHDSKAAAYWLAILAFLESSIFLLPVDVLYIPLLLKRPQKAYRYALIATIFSVIGGVVGWGIGAFAYKTIALPILTFYGKQDAMVQLQHYHSLKIIIILLFSSGLIHVPPIKLVNMFAGLVHVNIIIFVLLNIISRTIRLYGLAWLIVKYGESFMQKVKTIFKAEMLIYLLLTIAIAIASTSFFLQYILGFLPCKLCLIERYIFMLICIVTIILAINYAKQKSWLSSFIVLAVLVFSNLLLSVYHYGVEKRFWAGPQSCSVKNIISPQNTQQLLQSLQHDFVVPCDVPGPILLYLPLTLWSIIGSLLLLTILFSLWFSYLRK